MSSSDENSPDEGDFFGRKGNRKFTKEDAIYGMWNDDDSDEEKGVTRFSSRSKGMRIAEAPVDFISGGQLGKKKEKTREGGDSKPSRPKKPKVKDESRDASDFFKSMYSKKGGGAFGEGQDYKKYGLGAKLLQKMGWEKGKGLKDGSISKPIEVYVRQKQVGLGYGNVDSQNRQHDAQKLREDSDSAESGEDEEMEDGSVPVRDPKDRWKTSRRKQAPKTVYKTAADVLAESGLAAGESAAAMTIVDMTGPQTRIVSSLDKLSAKASAAGVLAGVKSNDYKHVRVPELLHNIRMLTDLAKVQLTNIEHKRVQATRSLERLREKKEAAQKAVTIETEKGVRLKDLQAILASVKERVGPQAPGTTPLAMEDLLDLVEMLQDKFAEEYIAYKLAALSASFAEHGLRELFSEWDPLTEPSRGVDTIRRWRQLLERSGDHGVYAALVAQTIVGPIRSAIINNWDPRDSDSCIDLVETWEAVLPPQYTNGFLHTLILPRLQQAVEAWSPQTDPIPLHVWVHPWLTILPDNLSALYPTIRHKLGLALSKWSPADSSALNMLRPWLSLFTPADLQTLCLRHVVPKLTFAMQQLVINPRSQDLAPFSWVTQWADIIHPDNLASVFVAEFFPKWLQVLVTWLAMSPDYEEITQWYRSWKSLFPENLVNHPIIKAGFNQALGLMNQALSSGSVVPTGAEEAVQYLRAIEARSQPKAPVESRGSASSLLNAHEIGSDSMSWKEVIAKIAEENGLLFVPAGSRQHEGKQIYTLGKVSVVLEESVVYARLPREDGVPGKEWRPISVPALIRLAS